MRNKYDGFVFNIYDVKKMKQYKLIIIIIITIFLWEYKLIIIVTQ